MSAVLCNSRLVNVRQFLVCLGLRVISADDIRAHNANECPGEMFGYALDAWPVHLSAAC